MESGPTNSQSFEGRRTAQREGLIEQIGKLRYVPENEQVEVATDPSRRDSTTTNIRSSFGSLSACNIDRKMESALFDLETDRLLDSLDASNLLLEDDMAIRFPDQAMPDDWFTHINSLLRTLMCSLAISALDDITVLRAYEMNVRTDGAMISCASQRVQQCQMDIKALGYTEIISPSSRGIRDPRRMNLESTESVSDSQAAGYHAIVDYITATVARLLVSGLKDDSVHNHKAPWHTMTLTVLAKVSAKMKVLGHRLSDFKVQVGKFDAGLPPGGVYLGSSVPRSSDMPRSRSSQHKLPPPPKIISPHGVTGACEPVSPLSIREPTSGSSNFSSELYDTDTRSLSEQSHMTAASEERPSELQKNYLSDMSEISTMVFHIIWRVLSALEARSTGGQKPNDLDLSVIAYATGTQKSSAMLYQDAEVEVVGSQTGVALGMCCRIFKILVNTAGFIQRKHEPRHLPAGSRLPRLRINMGTNSMASYAAREDLPVRSMFDLMSIIIPLSLMSPDVADRVFRACSKVGAPEMIRWLHAEGRDFTASISLCSAIGTSLIASTADGELCSSLSQAHFYLRPSHAEFTPNTTTKYQVPRWLRNIYSGRVTCRQLPQSNHRQSLHATPQWAIEKTAITIKCFYYTLPIMVGCGVLVTGGLLAGFLVGDRITGVDPFNLTMFCWIIAGFIILISKSIRVVSWPWRDFLLGRVTTRSVSELASVTGLDEQYIILHLLSLEGKVPLVTRGPFNSAFNWSDGETGFSIDVQPTVRTLFASGMVILEVLSSAGPVLVCMDLRPGMNRFRPVYTRKMKHKQNKNVEVLACVEPPREGEEDKDIFFRKRRIRWERVVGVYNNQNRRVR